MKKKYIWIALACVVCVGIGASLWLGGRAPAEPNPQIPVTDNQGSEVNVGEISGQPEVNPRPVTPPANSAKPEDDPVIAPGIKDEDVEVSLTPKVEKPAEADIDPDPNTHEKGEDPAPPEPPAVSQPPAQKPPAAETPKPSEPKGGDTNDKGQVWVDGFGWVDDGGENNGSKSGSDGDINKQVGDM